MAQQLGFFVYFDFRVTNDNTFNSRAIAYGSMHHVDEYYNIFLEDNQEVGMSGFETDEQS